MEDERWTRLQTPNRRLFSVANPDLRTSWQEHPRTLITSQSTPKSKYEDIRILIAGLSQADVVSRRSLDASFRVRRLYVRESGATLGVDQHPQTVWMQLLNRRVEQSFIRCLVFQRPRVKNVTNQSSEFLPQSLRLQSGPICSLQVGSRSRIQTHRHRRGEIC